MTRALLAPLQFLYAAGLRAREARFSRVAPYRLSWPVISIGNLSMGGSGKTPLVIHLAQSLGRQGFSVDVLSRGYGRSSTGIERVDPAGEADHFGDEPLMIAQSAAIPVFVGANRYQAGLRAEDEIANGGRHVHLLDDGFQHRQLARAADIVVVHADDLNDRLLPAGRLREPLAALTRADVIVLRGEDRILETTVRGYARSDCRFWLAKRTLAASPPGKRAVAFCGIARPGEFYRELAAAGTQVVEKVSFRDHHRYTASEIGHLAKLGRRHHCDEFVTTAKDAVKLNAGSRQSLATVAPLRIAQLEMVIEEEERALEELGALLAMWKQAE